MFHEESEHNLKYYCVDALGNSNEEDLDEEKAEEEAPKPKRKSTKKVAKDSTK